MMTCLPELMTSFLREWKRRFSIHLFLLLLLTAFIVPATSNASTNQRVEAAIKLIEQKEYTQALELLHDLEASIPNPGQMSNLLAFAYLGQGYQLLSSGDFSAARESFIAGRQYNEEDVRVWQGEAMTLFKQGHYAEAVSLLDQAIGLAHKTPMFIIC